MTNLYSFMQMISLYMKNSGVVQQACSIDPFGTFRFLHDKGIE